MKRLFGTDGIRGEAGRPPLDAETVRRFGRALAEVLGQGGNGVSVLLGRDTRESGPWLCEAIVAGLAETGSRAVDCGVITTPGLAFATRSGKFDAGVMISASHNPFADNGLKVFGSSGMKLADDVERQIEDRILDAGRPAPAAVAVTASVDGSLIDGYVSHLRELLADDDALHGMRILLDCANGSAHAIAPDVFRSFGADVATLGANPDGRNINLDCGSLHLERLADSVRAGGHDLGIAFDGDADRALAVDRRGRSVDGDYILYLLARMLNRRGLLDGDTVVATIMSNLWLEKQLERERIRLLRAPVGDKYVLELMEREGAVLGGEQSGHVIFRRRATTGDGIMTGLLLLRALQEEQRPLERILDEIRPYPQILINVDVREKPDLRSHAVIGPEVESTERALEGWGRVVLRYSGTEHKARVMIEGSDADKVRSHAEHLVEVIRREIGA